MSDKDAKQLPKRQYPPIYEKIVPIALVLLVIAITIVLVIATGVALGLFPWS
jgi:hypothetical protein